MKREDFFSFTYKKPIANTNKNENELSEILKKLSSEGAIFEKESASKKA